LQLKLQQTNHYVLDYFMWKFWMTSGRKSAAAIVKMSGRSLLGAVQRVTVLGFLDVNKQIDVISISLIALEHLVRKSRCMVEDFRFFIVTF
jgi:hypothetical protein